MFLESWNPLRAVFIPFANQVRAAILNFKMAAIENKFVLHISCGKPPILNLVSNPIFSGK
jgi:hypothetical protein